MFTSCNPTNESIVDSFPEMSSGEIEDALARAHAAQDAWKRTSFEERAQKLRDVAGYLRTHKEAFAELMAEEMGKPVTGGEAEIEKCARVCEYYADNGADLLAPEAIETEASESYVRFDPLGPILAVMPWNFPFWQVFRVAAPNIMAGNTIVLKHAANVPRCAGAIEKSFNEAGSPEATLVHIRIRAGSVAEVIHDRRIAGVTVTGSVAAGRAVAEQAGAAGKKSVLELGGSDPFIVLDDADIEAAVKTGASSRLRNAGQACNAAKRFILAESVADTFVSKLTELFEAKQVGDPRSRDTDIGPLATEDMLRTLERQIEESVAAGAKVATGGERAGDTGFFYRPTIIRGVTKDMPAYHEEFFGPVAIIFVVKDEDDAVALANDTTFGLGASLWTQDRARAERLIPRIESGNVFVNSGVSSDPRLPFGGVGDSGFGRELSHYGIREFVNIKTVSIKW